MYALADSFDFGIRDLAAHGARRRLGQLRVAERAAREGAEVALEVQGGSSSQTVEHTMADLELLEYRAEAISCTRCAALIRSSALICLLDMRSSSSSSSSSI